MQWLTKTAIIKTYILAILVVALIVAPTQEFVLAIALLSLNLYATYKQVLPKINATFLLGTIILTPLTLTQLTGNILASLCVLPAIYLLDQNLKEYAITQPLQPQKRTVKLTPLFKSTIIVLGAILATSIALVNVTLITTTTVLTVYFAIISGKAIIKIPKKPIQETETWSRLLVGNTEKKTIQLSSVTKQLLYITVTPLQTWVRVKQSTYFLKGDKNADIEVTFTPPLAGSTKIQLNVSILDIRGLIQNTQLIEPIDLHVLPRAKYAEWLAKKFLEHSGAGASTIASESILKGLKSARNSIEYFGNRPYQPGDTLREVDWKHTYMLGELTVKEFAGAQGQPIIISANLSANNHIEVDRVAYSLVMTALASAIEALPSGTAIYNQKKVISTTAPSNPRSTLRKCIQLTAQIELCKESMVTTSPTDESMIKGILKHRTRAVKESTDFLAELLIFEFETTQKAALEYSGVKALNEATKTSIAPPLIAVISNGIIDPRLIWALGAFKKKGHHIIISPCKSHDIQSYSNNRWITKQGVNE